ncbi:metal dependent phosphohydrolase [Desulforamulus reducens MI-1]|uniref:Metal dependent phosphohydrolase n=1 Tax=Desulforamulus reducens (strain ATCC BAA-1160 / DSM 100696 / MI-1) TaxID=349161 RepID=A4J828_DESRM|nr:HD domain-containing phosphohydrolase [Desulforamulus reducens]ABO51231.1 metal dependent phosphohydrolase [Desulforamulus reducens MI-1]
MKLSDEYRSSGTSKSKSYQDIVHLQERLIELEFINEVLITLIQNTDMDSTLAAILDLAIEITHSEAGGILLTDQFANKAQIMLVRGELTAQQLQRVLDKTKFMRRFKTGKEVISIDSKTLMFQELLKVEPALRAFIAVPLIVGGRTEGMLVLMHRHAGIEDHRASYSKQDIATISIFASQAALILHNTRLKLENGRKEVYLKTIAALVTAIDAKDPYTRNHSKNVARTAVALARGLKLSEAEIQNIEYGALLHDIGKIGIPEVILNKEGKLDLEEYEKIKTHPDIGVKILQPVDFLQSISGMIHYHHERYDGNGYPKGLRGEEIPFEARIVSVADAWDAMISDRSYRKGMPPELALQELQNHAGGQFDSYMVKVFTNLMRKEVVLLA